MKVLKGILYTLLALIIIALLLGLIIPRTYIVKESIVIHQPKNVVFDYVRNLRNQENYSIWMMQDTGIKIEYTGTDGTVGSKAHWNSEDNNAGEGIQQITAINDTSIVVDLHFIRPFQAHQKAATEVRALSSHQTEVSLLFYGKEAYPLNILSFIGKKIISDASKENLKNLKSILER